MAGMFYSLEEVCSKLSKSEDEVKALIKEGRLREFRDGPNMLFKINEVEALLSDTSLMAAQEDSAIAEPVELADEEEILLAPEQEQDPLAADELTNGDAADELTNGDTADELTNGDTAITTQGVNVLGQTDSEYELAEDTLSETKASSEGASLEEIEDDVNLDTFGSGSGLLDLSLQADDTSLGGILDEIYTPEEGADEEAADSVGSAMDVTAEADNLLDEQASIESQVVPAVGAAVMAPAYAEAEADTMSNALGMMLFLPLLVVVYAMIVSVASLQGITSSLLEKTQGIIWYIMGGVAVAAGLVVGLTAALGGDKTRAPKKAKPKKEKAPKKAKAEKKKKEKKKKK